MKVSLKILDFQFEKDENIMKHWHILITSLFLTMSLSLFSSASSKEVQPIHRYLLML